MVSLQFCSREIYYDFFEIFYTPALLGGDTLKLQNFKLWRRNSEMNFLKRIETAITQRIKKR